MTSDLQRERSAAAAAGNGSNGLTREEVNALRFYLEGSNPERSRKKALAYQLVERDPYLNPVSSVHSADLTRPEARERTMAQIRRVLELRQALKNDPELFNEIFEVMVEMSDSFSMRIGVHHILFRTSIQFFATEEQQKWWRDDADNYRMIGAFAMTELGHSSSLQGIETTATFDKAHDEWVLHSPTLTSTKWWMGMVGQTATHTVLLAQTIVNNEPMGLNWFMVPLRNVDNGRLMPGVTCGDLGAKAGRPGLDNGWIQLTQVRIPRTHMMMRFCQVDRDGNVDGPPHPAIMYATLIPERLTLTYSVRMAIGKALVIACRYTIGRRQGNANQQIISYQSQQVNLLPNLAGLLVIRLAERSVMAYWNHLLELQKNDPDAYMMLLPDIHATSAGVKATVTWWGSEVLELCRRALWRPWI